ncbi:MAG: ATPase, T2SS/T4P/T4SS family [Candidatus Hadarchaeales archaeon]
MAKTVRGDKLKRYVPDESVLTNGLLRRMTEAELRDAEIIIPHGLMANLEHQAKMMKESGVIGLKEIKRIKEAGKERGITVVFSPAPEEKNDHMTLEDEIRKIAMESGATLITSDQVSAEVAGILGIETMYLEPGETGFSTKLMKYFGPDTMSVHLKARVRPMAKVGRPGRFKLEVLDERPMDERELKEIGHEIMELAKRDPDCFIEFEREGASMVQLREFRIAITRPPFSDGFEITAVRPVATVKLEDYRLSEKLKNRLKARAEGILVAGPPGAGKSTFAQALAEFYRSQGKIVKTMESPRDLQVSEEITQYTALEGDMAKTADLLLLVRPDYTIYDELRKTSDFQIFADMRLAGVGMIGVVHSTRAIDAVQRLIGRVELGMIPMIADTVIFIKNGELREVYSLRTTVRVPSGMSEADLARPLIEVADFETEEPRYEIYTFGEQVVVADVREQTAQPRTHRRRYRYQYR